MSGLGVLLAYKNNALTMRKNLLAALAIAALCLSGCTDRLTDFTVISTRNVPLGSDALTMKKADKRVKGKDTAPQILGIPFGSPNMKEAIDKALDKYPGAIALSDGVIKSKWWTCFFYGQSSYIVEGTPVYEDRDNAEASSARLNMPNDTRQKSIGNYYENSQPQTERSSQIMFFHEVKKGESLSSIAKMYGVSIADIIRTNKLSSSEIEPGQRLTIMLQQ